jgi:fructose-1,6-bisphosphatase I
MTTDFHEKFMTLDRFIHLRQKLYPEARGEFSRLMSDLNLCAKIINREVNKAGLLDVLGLTDGINVHGESQAKLDVFAQTIMTSILEQGGHLCIMASEESEQAMKIPSEAPLGTYAINFDPLDGSSNLDVNVSVGTIFSIFRRKSPEGRDGTIQDLMRPGVEQIAAGYFIYGSSTMFVFTTGQGVHGFTLDPSVGSFVLSHPDIKMPEQGTYYSANEAYYPDWDVWMKKYIDDIKTKNNPIGAHTSRYIGSLVADFHRNLLKGGIFLYPGDKKRPEGKLRLLYECSPLAFIAEQAGGKAITGEKRIMEVVPNGLHQRVPLFIGSKNNIDMLEEYYLKYKDAK